jgi:hypothetical protein
MISVKNFAVIVTTLGFLVSLAFIGYLTFPVQASEQPVVAVEEAPTLRVSAQTVDLVALKAEILTDPKGLGYAQWLPPTQSNFEIAKLMNTVGLSGETIEVNFVQAAEVQGAVVGLEFLALTAGEQRLWLSILTASQGAGIPIKGSSIKNQMLVVWNVTTTTRANLAALQVKSATRGEVLFGDGTQITPDNVDLALRQP